MNKDDSIVLHASAVAVQGKGLLICGKSGAGKSALALELMARGAKLIADDRTIVSRIANGGLHLSTPPTIAGMIEARGVGILNAVHASDGAPLAAVLDLDIEEDQRLPPPRDTMLLNCSVPLLHNCASAYFASALVQYLKAGRKV